MSLGISSGRTISVSPSRSAPEDREALLIAATYGNPQFFLGTDSAPHAVETKECASGCAGCFTAPIAIELLADIFDKRQRLTMLEGFTSEYGALFYDLKPNETFTTLKRETWTVPGKYGSVVPFKAGEQLDWRIVGGSGDV